jgi:hypothetical protein
MKNDNRFPLMITVMGVLMSALSMPMFMLLPAGQAMAFFFGGLVFAGFGGLLYKDDQDEE